jgi:transcription initiation factor TFIID subunit 2
MTIRIHEADGTPYEHVLDIRSPFKRYEVPFNTKYKRVRRNTKRYLARQAAAQAAAEGDAEAAEAMGMIDMGFGLEIWEKEKERENWKVADWTEDDEQVMSGATYEWIRMDADFEWIATIEFTQPDFMWVSQLQRDRDVVAQLEVVHPINSTYSFDSFNSSGSQGVIEDAKCHCFEYIHKDCLGNELFLQGSLRSSPCTCDGVCHSLV